MGASIMYCASWLLGGAGRMGPYGTRRDHVMMTMACIIMIGGGGTGWWWELEVALGWSSPCKNVCGDTPVMYPFGTAAGCGSPAFESYVYCSADAGKMQLHTPTGVYPVQSIDYANNRLVLEDPGRMSTCAAMQRTAGFGLPVGAPFSFAADNTVVLLGCAAASSVYNSLSPLCDAAGTPVCRALYNCAAAAQLGLTVGGVTSSCCVYSRGQLSTPPYQVNLALLQCAAYTSVYSFGTDTGTYRNPSTWAYGIALDFFYDESAFYASCRACQLSNGICAYNVYGFVCICSAGVNTTTRCYGDSDIGHAGYGSRLPLLHHVALWTTGLGALAFLTTSTTTFQMIKTLY